MSGEYRLATTRWQAQTDVRNLRQAGKGAVGAAKSAKTPGLFRFLRQRLIGVLGPADTCLLEEAAKNLEGFSLVALEFHGGRLDP